MTEKDYARHLGPLKRLNRPLIDQRLIGTETTLDINCAGERFLVPHDALLDWVQKNLNAVNTKSWIDGGLYHWPTPSQKMLTFLRTFAITDQ